MWRREELKWRAKDSLKGAYWQAFLVSFILAIFTNMGGKKAASEGRNINYSNSGGFSLGAVNTSKLLALIIIFVIAVIIGSVIMILIKLFVGYSMEVGGRKYFIQAAQGDGKLDYLVYGFSQGRYFKIMKTMFLVDLYTALWSLLFIIPGIIKGYSYSMVPYILADNPEMSSSRAIELSIQMTRGEKWNMFVLGLSFLGWYMLGALALGIGVVFVHPYRDSTFAELYLVLRKQAIDRGLCDYQELNLIREVRAIEEM